MTRIREEEDWLDESFPKCIAWDDSPREVAIRKNVYVLPRDRYLAPIGIKFP